MVLVVPLNRSGDYLNFSLPDQCVLIVSVDHDVGVNLHAGVHLVLLQEGLVLNWIFMLPYIAS